MINLYWGDCMEEMKLMKDNQYDLAIVDPPYGIGFENGSSYYKINQNKKWDKIPNKKYFDELFRVSKNQIIFGGNYFDLPITQGWLCWDKLFSDDKREKGLQRSGIKRKDRSDFELIWTSVLKKAKFIRYTFIGNLSGFYDNLNVDYNYTGKIHPTQKPVALYKWLLKNYAKEGDKILDTHGGSMSIALACHDMKYSLDLWELDEDYYKAGVKRYNQHIRQLQLF